MAFRRRDERPEQHVRFRLLTPRRAAPLDPSRRTSAKEKLAGDELGHFGAFLKRSWRANDWMWGRVDAATFLCRLLGQPLGWSPTELEAQTEIVQTEIVREEAGVIRAAVDADIAAGASFPKGWALKDLADLPGDAMEQARAFLEMNTIGAQRVRDQWWTPLGARVSTRAAAVTAHVLQHAGLPMGSLVSKATRPLGGLATIAHRYVSALHPRTRAGGVFRAAAIAVAGTAVAAFASLAGVDLGVLGPVAWLTFAGAFLGLAMLAPLTSLLGLVLLTVVGLFAVLPAHVLYDWWSTAPRWLIEHRRALAGVAAVVVMLLMSLRSVGCVDRKWRGVLRRMRANHDELREAVNE